jgi:PAS domain S-box-containing protein
MTTDDAWLLLDCLPDAVVLVRKDGRIHFANSQVQHVLGYEPRDLADVPLESLIPERFRQQHQKYVLAYLANPAFRPMEITHDLFALHRDGRELPVEISLGFVPDEPGILAVATIRDVSYRKIEESRLRQALAEIQNLRKKILAENLYLKKELTGVLGVDEIVGESEPLQTILRKIEQVASTDLNVLILGETGTGKELVARAIHHRSARRDRPFVKVNCAALHPELIESELFGHEKGSFTGAFAKHIGRFELANDGTVFLDEVAEIPPHLQAKLLRVLQEREFERLGSSTTTRVDVRVLAATNRNVQELIKRGRFRSDLYFRMAVLLIEVPPLRHRRGDIPLLVWHIIQKEQAKLGKRIGEVPRDVMDALIASDWPGNIRELENVINRGLVVSHGSEFRLDDSITKDKSAPQLYRTTSRQQRRGSLAEVERSHIMEVLKRCNWRVKGNGNAADCLGLNPSTLRFRMKKLGISRPTAERGL